MTLPAILLALALLNPWPCSPWVDDVEAAAREFGAPALVMLALMETESACDPNAKGASGEHGLLQLMPGTAQYVANLTGWSPDAILHDPQTNIRAGVWYWSLWYHRFRSIDLALSSYNGGPLYVVENDEVNPITERYVAKVRSAVVWPVYPAEICGRGRESCLVEEW